MNKEYKSFILYFRSFFERLFPNASFINHFKQIYKHNILNTVNNDGVINL